MVYTKNLLVISVFTLYTGKSTWIEGDFQHFVAMVDLLKMVNAPTPGPELDFWNDINAGMRQTAIGPYTVFDRTLRFVLQGPSPSKHKIVSLLQSAFGELLPSQSKPYAVRMIFNEEELQAKRNQMHQQRNRKSLTCVLMDMEAIWRMKDYEKDLLRSINIANDSLTVEGEFLASRGAAIMALHFLNLPCMERQRARKRPWEWDNKRKSTWFYGDHDVKDKAKTFSDFLSAEEEHALLSSSSFD